MIKYYHKHTHIYILFYDFINYYTNILGIMERFWDG